MERFILRIWLTDRPGVLGAVASRIGAVRGDVVGIEILEREAGMAVDELVVELPDASLVDLMLREIEQVDGVKVEDVRGLHSAGERLTRELDAAVAVAEVTRPDEVLATLCRGVMDLLHAPWAVVVHPELETLVASSGTSAPPPAWLVALAVGRGGQSATAVDDILLAALAPSSLVLIAGGSGLRIRERERQAAASLGRMAGAHWIRLSCEASAAEHPSRRRSQPVAI